MHIRNTCPLTLALSAVQLEHVYPHIARLDAAAKVYDAWLRSLQPAAALRTTPAAGSLQGAGAAPGQPQPAPAQPLQAAQPRAPPPPLLPAAAAAPAAAADAARSNGHVRTCLHN